MRRFSRLVIGMEATTATETTNKIQNMKIKITTVGKLVIRDYRGYVISSYDNSQLGDGLRGYSYLVYQNRAAYDAGNGAISAHECLDRLAEAKEFVDALCK